MQPLEGVKVLDFSTLLPGPMCTLLLADAGADVIKIERAQGDEMRSYVPKFGTDSVNFALLNRGKKSIVADLKSPEVRTRIEALLREADVLVEQFRPGVMDRLGLGYADVSKINPRIIYCSITGYGQDGPYAQVAAHDLNYQAQAGMLSLAADDTGKPIVPAVLTADLAGGAYPAVMNILLALRQRDRSGAGCHLDVSMADNLFTLMYWGLGNGWTSGEWPTPAGDLVTGGSPRYQIYETADGQYLAAAPLEDKFWGNFLTLIGAQDLRDETDARAVKARIAAIIKTRSAQAWLAVFEGHDTCVSRVLSLDEATQDPHFRARGVFTRRLAAANGDSIAALPTIINRAFLAPSADGSSPELGQHTQEILK